MASYIGRRLGMAGGHSPGLATPSADWVPERHNRASRGDRHPICAIGSWCALNTRAFCSHWPCWSRCPSAASPPDDQRHPERTIVDQGQRIASANYHGT